jgi:peptidoglycan/xylan/chitin deacetylase (PgdA/CDA1 family)
MIAFIIGGCLSVGLFVYAGVPWLYARWLRASLARRVARQGSVALTFDDGPSSRLTPALLELLSAHDAKATFLVLGRNVNGHEQIIKEIAGRGHEICSHGYEHLHHWRVSPLRAIRDIRQGWRALDATLGREKGRYAFRPPYGKLNIVTLAYLRLCKVPIVYWSLDSGDTRTDKPSAQDVAGSVKRQRGAVVLSHDFERQNTSDDSAVLETAQAVLTVAKQTGMPVVTVSQVLGPRGRAE